MNRVKRADRFPGKRLPRALNNLRADAQNVPAGSHCDQMCVTVCSLGLSQITNVDGALQYAVAFD
jgi:hypothetical protein